MTLTITWLGHAAFLLDDGQRKILIDPWLTGNPKFPQGFSLNAVDYILLTHLHSDHLGDTIALAKKHGATVVAMYETTAYLQQKGVEHVAGMNIGGKIVFDGLTVHMTQAVHSSSVADEGTVVYGGMPNGFVIEFGGEVIYNTGDTGLFSDMNLLNDIYKPTMVILPIGDRFTMGPELAAYACNHFFTAKKIIPQHYGTFGLLTGTVEEFVPLVKDKEVLVLEPGKAYDF